MRSERETAEGAAASLLCPFCDAADTELISLFGSQLLMSQRRCRACGSYSEALRDTLGETTADDGD